MKRAGDSSYNIMPSRSRTAAIPNEAQSKGVRSSNRSQVDSELIESAFAKSNSRTFYKKRPSNNAGYKNTGPTTAAANMGRAASAIDANQMRNTTQSGFNFKQSNVDRQLNRSGVHKN